MEVKYIITEEVFTNPASEHQFLVRWKNQPSIDDAWLTQIDFRPWPHNWWKLFKFNSTGQSSIAPEGVDVAHHVQQANEAKCLLARAQARVHNSEQARPIIRAQSKEK